MADEIVMDTADGNCRELLDVLMAQGVSTIVLSPGSRNTPLLIGASAREGLRKYMINDERTAAFTALGISLASHKPVALACTSGTALYNYAPAVAEAYYQRIPLIVITADRPMQWIGQDDSQTLVQPGALDKIVKKSFDIPARSVTPRLPEGRLFDDEQTWYVNRVVNEAVLTATTGIPDPVHINIQLDNPLNRTVPYKEGNPRTVSHYESAGTLSPPLCEKIAKYLRNKKILVVAGFMQPDHNLNRALDGFLETSGAMLMAETISNLHIGRHERAFEIDSVLRLMQGYQKEQLRPDVIISIGGSLVSRKLKEFLRDCTGAEHWTLADTALSADCFQRLDRHFDSPPAAFFGRIGREMRRWEQGSGHSYHDAWMAVKGLLAESQTTGVPTWSELLVFDHILDTMPDRWNLFLSNGTPVRYAQIMMKSMPHACYCNRGVSGIDGTNATAFGASLAYKGTTLLITGDMSFSYCPEILNLARLGGDLRIVVINNAGGGIFRFIDTTRTLPMRERYFCSDPQLPLRALAEAYGWRYLHAGSDEELADVLPVLYTTARVLLEVTVDPQTSADTLRDYMANKL